MSDEVLEPKVISLASRQAYDPGPADGDAGTTIDTASEAMLEAALEEVQAGRLKGVSLLAFISESNIPVTFVQLPPGEAPEAAAMRVLGATDMLKGHVIDTAFGDDDDE